MVVSAGVTNAVVGAAVVVVGTVMVNLLADIDAVVFNVGERFVLAVIGAGAVVGGATVGVVRLVDSGEDVALIITGTGPEI